MISEGAEQRRSRVALPSLRRLWKAGGELPDGPVYVSMNDYWILRWRDVPRVAAAGMRLRRAWPRMPGAVGLWFAVYSGGRRQVSVSIWQSQADLRRFVTSPEHREIMREFRNAGSLITTPWTADHADPEAIWRAAEDRLMGRVEGVAHH